MCADAEMYVLCGDWCEVCLQISSQVSRQLFCPDSHNMCARILKCMSHHPCGDQLCEVHILVQTSLNMCALMLKCMSCVVTNCVNFIFWSRPAMRKLLLKCMSWVVTDCEFHTLVQTSHACAATEMHVQCGDRMNFTLWSRPAIIYMCPDTCGD